MAGTVVVGVDGSDDSGHALTWSAGEAQRRGDVLQIIYCLHMPIVTDPFASTTTVPQIADLREHAEGVLEAVADTARQMAPSLDVRTELSIRPPSTGLLEASEDASLVVVGTRGLSALGALFLGSVSTRVAAHAACPTIVVPAGEHVALGPVVVGVDGSEHGDAALRFAVAEAAVRGSELVVVHGRRSTEGLDLPAEFERSEQAQAEALVAEALERARVGEHPEVTVTTRMITASPTDAVVDAGREAAMTVVGSRGRGGFKGMLLGSVSQAVLHSAQSPVAVVQADDHPIVANNAQ